MVKQEFFKEHSILIEEIGVLIEERADLSPMTSRIYATLVLASDEGLTFEEITEMHQASKSTVSNSVTLLIKLNYIQYFTKPKERKRYLKVAKFYVKNAIEKYCELFEKEVIVVGKINEFNKKYNPKKFEDESNAGTLYEEYLTSLVDGFKKKELELCK